MVQLDWASCLVFPDDEVARWPDGLKMYLSNDIACNGARGSTESTFAYDTLVSNSSTHGDILHTRVRKAGYAPDNGTNPTPVTPQPHGSMAQFTEAQGVQHKQANQVSHFDPKL